jgi:Domain of unknown function (DUF4345)
MDKHTEKRFLQAAVALGCVVPLAAGLLGVVHGASMLAHVGEVGGGVAAGVGGEVAGNITLDSHVRYLSGLLFAIGLGFLSCIPDIERQGARATLLSAIVVTGGLARLYGVIIDGWPAPPMVFALAMELAVVPLLWLWQRRVARLLST